jgi:hypothetical protein
MNLVSAPTLFCLHYTQLNLITPFTAIPRIAMDSDPDKVHPAFRLPRSVQQPLRATNDVKVEQQPPTLKDSEKRGARKYNRTPLWLLCGAAAIVVCLLFPPFKYFSISQELQPAIPVSSSPFQTPSISPISQPDTTIKMSNEQT